MRGNCRLFDIWIAASALQDLGTPTQPRTVGLAFRPAVSNCHSGQILSPHRHSASVLDGATIWFDALDGSRVWP